MNTFETVNINTESVPSIHGCALLMDMNISVWSGKKLDRDISDEVCDRKNASTRRAAAVQKNLAAGNKQLEDLQKFAAGIRNWMYIKTQPWSDSGTRLVASGNFLSIKEQLSVFEQEFWKLVDEVVAGYSNFVSAQAFTLGDMFKREDYPSPDEIRNKFRFQVTFYPVPATGDWRVDIQNEALSELQNQYQSAYEARVKSAMDDAWARLHKHLKHISDKLTTRVKADGSEEKQRLYSSMLEDANDLCDLLKGFNLTGDPKLEAARSELASVLGDLGALGRSIKDDTGIELLRDSVELREATKSKVDAILNKLSF